ncbi:helix-turn-helix domain-containing protein [Streptomyces gamaensis]|uniref:Helix-turn-helix domain-containing protein n=1 Tax=Streptomyces gamaensis TaxID=1763542 RepID=A0ABW0ZD29_9ACTN
MSGERLLPAECARLAAELRELKGRTGLSLAALAERTLYSKSSWERYLNGRKLPPRQAVDALCQVAEEPPGRLLALWELAEQAWSGRSESAPVPPPAAAPPRPAAAGAPRPARPGRVWVVSAALTAATALVVSLVLLTTGWRDAGRPREEGNAAASSPYPQSYAPGCAGADCDGADPLRMGCGAQDMVTTLLTHRATGGRRLELRYAQRCGAVWVRATKLRLGDRVQLSVPGAGTKEVGAATPRDTEVYLTTGMTPTNDPREARVCLRPGDGGTPECLAPPGRGRGDEGAADAPEASAVRVESDAGRVAGRPAPEHPAATVRRAERGRGLRLGSSGVWYRVPAPLPAPPR